MQLFEESMIFAFLNWLCLTILFSVLTTWKSLGINTAGYFKH